MRVINAKFISSFADAQVYKQNIDENMVEVCFVGRSNVGKSSFINTLLGQRLAKTSSLPGRTRLINLFGATIATENEKKEFLLTDLPGYGFNRASKTDSEKWGKLIESYLSVSKVKLVFILADCRVKSPLDVLMTEYLYYYRIPFCVLLSKSDKVSRNELNKSVIETAAHLKIGRDDIIAVSQNGLNKDQVLKKIAALIEIE